MTAIQLESLVKDFGAIRALAGVSASVARGRVGLLGPNGAGKSTLVKCLLGLVIPTQGSAKVLGIDISEDPMAVRQQVGYLPETDCHIPGMTAPEFVAYAGELSGMGYRDARKRAHEVLDYVGIDEERYRPVDTYSTGMRQKVKLAQALVHDPDLLFLDEPTNGLDPQGRERMLALVRDLGENHGIGIVYSSHLLHDVEEVCTDVVILRDGQVVSQGPIESLRKPDENAFEIRVKGEIDGFRSALETAGGACSALAPDRLRAAFQRDPAWISNTVFQTARACGVQIRAFRPMRSTLEDVFLDALQTPDQAPSSPGEA